MESGTGSRRTAATRGRPRGVGARAVVCLLVFLAGVWGAALAQVTTPTRPFTRIAADWSQQLDQVQAYIQGPSYDPARNAEMTALVQEVRAAAIAERDLAAGQMDIAQRLLDALGEPPTPDGDATPEPPEVAEQRQVHSENLVTYRSRVALSELTAARALELERALSDQIRDELVSQLTYRYPAPLAPSTLGAAVPAFARHLGAIATAPAVWFDALTPEQRASASYAEPLLLLTIAALVAIVLRRILLRRLGRDPENMAPTYARRTLAAVVQIVARGIVPAAVFAVIVIYVDRGDSPLSGPFADIVSVFAAVMVLFLLATAVPRAVFAPDMPAWRLTALPPGKSSRISRLIMTIVAVISVDVFLRESNPGGFQSEALQSVFAFVSNTVSATLVILLVRPSLWRTDPPDPPDDAADAADTADAPSSDSDGPFADDEGDQHGPARRSRWRWLPPLIMLTAAASIVVTLIGYAALGDYLLSGLIVSAALAGFLFLVRGLLRELVGVAVRSQLTHHRVSLGHRARTSVKFWLRAALDPLLVVVWLMLVAPFWGVPWEDLRRWVVEIVEGVAIGNVTISLVDVFLALVAFVVVLVIARMVERVLAEDVLPETSLQPGLQNSLSTGARYIGLVLAFAIGILVLGIDLTNLALIAGALSIGIGLGLQNIVNNFVSGFILLIERPIAAGDWIVVGEHEGFVKRISVRATEVETFQRASVIVPNADLLSGAVINWTHENLHGRIDVVVGVAYGSPVARVRDILFQAADEHPKVLIDPQPFVLFRDFGDSALVFELRCYTGDVLSRLSIGSDIRYFIDAKFREEGIEIPFPQRVVHLAAPAAAGEPPSPPDQPPDQPTDPARRGSGHSDTDEAPDDGDGSGNGSSSP